MSYQLVDNLRYEDHLASAQDVHEVRLLVDETMRKSVIGDRDLVSRAIVAKRASTVVSTSVAQGSAAVAKAVSASGQSTSEAIDQLR
jgi:hypothetical protein